MSPREILIARKEWNLYEIRERPSYRRTSLIALNIKETRLNVAGILEDSVKRALYDDR